MSAPAGKPLQVLHIVPALFGSDQGVVGGAERYALELARHMAGETPTALLTFGTKSSRERLGALSVRVIGNPWYVGGQRSNPVSLALIGEVLRADVVHCHQRHVLASRRVYGHAGKPWAHVILGGVDTDKFSPGDPSARDGAALFVGRLLPHKGIDDLIRAVPASMPLDVIGKGYHAAFLRKLRTLSQGKRVRFRHDCDDEGLVKAYQRALCVVLPSVYRERMQ